MIFFRLFTKILFFHLIETLNRFIRFSFGDLDYLDNTDIVLLQPWCFSPSGSFWEFLLTQARYVYDNIPTLFFFLSFCFCVFVLCLLGLILICFDFCLVIFWYLCLYNYVCFGFVFFLRGWRVFICAKFWRSFNFI